ncbi:hypothetical protein RFI_25069 [Reticulomyxa filosa]|uniref:Sulfotransferase domain-containing protein n=1 Tax=Reticulomyxa filosa TaxID=46433 RepID=X6MEH4_RETFI|nr:hypothetical protein RFI_25069 [Reticulomyxa filosa]|eukprot:ETO12309.1 hypothetical protein RFI_25069 [Reticulomyxa filosa]
MLSYVAMFELQKLTCLFDDHLCWSLVSIMTRFQEIPLPLYPLHKEKLLEIIEQLSNVSATAMCLGNEKNEISLSVFDKNPCKDSYSDKLELFLIISQRRGGSTWLYQALDAHSQAYVQGEYLFKWYDFHCSRFHFLVGAFLIFFFLKSLAHDLFLFFFIFFSKKKKKVVNVPKKIDKELLLMQSSDNRCIDYSQENIANKKSTEIKKRLVGFEIQIEQIQNHLYPIFSQFVACNNITILHVQRSAAIASYWSYQADEFERMKTFNIGKMIRRQRYEHRKHISSMALIPTTAQKYVELIENRHQDFHILFTAPLKKKIKYHRFFYEDLIGEKKWLFWYAIQAFLGIEQYSIPLTTGVKREHPRSCYQRIDNWKELQTYLNSTDSIYACQKKSS